MKKEIITEIRVISVDHDRTSKTEQLLNHSMPKDLPGGPYRLRSVYCHLEAGRCGVPAGKVAIEVEGQIIWRGAELTDKLAASFWQGLPEFVRQQRSELGIS